MAEIVRGEFLFARRLDRGNPTRGNIGADFNRLGIGLWSAARRMDARNTVRQLRLEQMSDWRNAIAHQDFDRTQLVPEKLHLPRIRAWRRMTPSLTVSTA